MEKCTLCGRKAVFSSPFYCKEHFILYVEEKVKKTITDHNLIKEGEKIAVAVSGGKDSQTVLYILHQLYGDDVSGIAIDEGISGYRDKTLNDLKKFCELYSIPFEVYSFSDVYGKPLDKFSLPSNNNICKTCGVLRRHLLNKKACGFDKIATGHNLDDECQSILMNFLKGGLFLSAKMGPKSGIKEREGFTRRVKPLYFCTEKEIAVYAFLKEFPVRFTECPNAEGRFRSHVRDALNEVEVVDKGMKRKIVQNFLLALPKLKIIYANEFVPKKCGKCGEPSMNLICNACNTVEKVVYAN